MLPFLEARARLCALAPKASAERVSLGTAHGRVLASDLAAPVSLPRIAHSTMDGYAVRVGDLASLRDTPPFVVPVVGESRAGAFPRPLEAKSAMRIFTGAPLPEGADSVLMQEETTREDDLLHFERMPAEGRFVRNRGDDIDEGAVALPKGTRIGPAQLALLAAFDVMWVTVARKPRVAIVTTGDELRLPGTFAANTTPSAASASLPECLGIALASVITSLGAEARLVPIVGDDKGATELALDEALRSSDLVVTVGGASVGDHDLVRPSLLGVGATIDFWKVAIKPGKPLLVGERNGTIVLGLPGNPASALVTFALFGVPVLRSLLGERNVFPTPMRALVTLPIRHEKGRTEFVRATLSPSAEGPRVEPITNQASGAILNMAHANALVVVNEDAESIAANTWVDVLPYSELGL